jgi:hypothetical protein
MLPRITHVQKALAIRLFIWDYSLPRGQSPSF